VIVGEEVGPAVGRLVGDAVLAEPLRDLLLEEPLRDFALEEPLRDFPFRLRVEECPIFSSASWWVGERSSGDEGLATAKGHSPAWKRSGRRTVMKAARIIVCFEVGTVCFL